MKYQPYIILLLVMTFFTQAEQVSEKDAISKVLDSFHQAAAAAQTQRYFSLMADNAIFLGTDAKERWIKEDFERYVEPHFSQGNGWIYIPQHRNVSIIDNTEIAFFDELLHNPRYGECRGTGVLVKTSNGWKIKQYNLSVPIPNGTAKEVVQQIKAFKAKG